MTKNLMPLYYAIVKQFEAGGELDARDVMAALAPDYGTYKLFTRKDVDEALATAKENGLLDEAGWELDEDGRLAVRYRATDFGLDMMRRYLA